MIFKINYKFSIMKFIPKNEKTLKNFKIVFTITGLLSTIWILIRVLQKPSRIYYPCIQASFPLMTTFLIWLTSMIAATFAFKYAQKLWRNTRYLTAFIFFILGITGSLIVVFTGAKSSYAGVELDVPRVSELTDTRNDPVGDATGLYPGRVVWVHDENSTNENCTNTNDDYWYFDKNTNQLVVNQMLANGIKKIAGETKVSDAWETLFTYHNIKKGLGKKGYTLGEKICIKINLTNSCCNNNENKGDATPQLVLALMTHLVDSVGIAQEDITLGDPFRTFRSVYYDKCHTAYPKVNYIDDTGADERTLTPVTATPEFYTSDGSFSSPIPQAYKDADYFINMPCLKSHDAAGITIGAKNHQGSVLGVGQTASNQSMGADLHYCYPSNTGYTQMGKYRHLVDYMGNKYMGGNTLLYIVDALWAGHNWRGEIYPWQISPFNNDWMSSLFLSQDPVAIESVGFDFLFEEYLKHADTRGGQDFPLYQATQDYIHQAASPENWPEGITYDPENDGTPIGSLGVHEHWNGVGSKQYSGNLGNTGGIHLVSIPESLVAGSTNNYERDEIWYTAVSTQQFSINEAHLSTYPNPVSDRLNVKLSLKTNQMNSESTIQIRLISINGAVVELIDVAKLNSNNFNKAYDLAGMNFAPGHYILNCQIIDNKQVHQKSTSIIIK